MVWCKIERIEDSMFDNISKVIFFNYLGRERTAVVSPQVLKYLKIETVEIYKEVFVTKTFNRDEKEIFVIKKVR